MHNNVVYAIRRQAMSLVCFSSAEGCSWGILKLVKHVIVQRYDGIAVCEQTKNMDGAAAFIY